MIEPVQCRLNVGNAPGNGLFHLMRDRSRELPHRCDATGVRQLCLHFAIAALAVAGFGFRSLAPAQVKYEADHLGSSLVERGDADQNGDTTTILEEKLLFKRRHGS